MAGRCDFMYEWQLKSSPIDEETAEKILRWMGINPEDAMKYMGVSTSRIVLFKAACGLKGDLYPREYQTTGPDRQ